MWIEIWVFLLKSPLHCFSLVQAAVMASDTPVSIKIFLASTSSELPTVSVAYTTHYGLPGHLDNMV